MIAKQPPAQDSTGHRKGLLKLNDTEIYYEDTGGPGPVVIFSHALLLNTNLFTPQVAALKTHYRCISYEHRGQGRSADKKGFSISMDLLCADVVSMIEVLQLAKVHFCGLSMGGFVGLRLAARHPELVESLILCSTSGEAESFDRLMKYMLLNCMSFAFGPASVAKFVAPIVYGRSTYSDPARAEEYLNLINQIASNRWSIWRAVNGVIFRPSVLHELSKIHVPTIVIVGEEDTCTVPARSEFLAANIAGAKLERVARAGHAVTLEQPESVNKILSHFLASVTSERR